MSRVIPWCASGSMPRPVAPVRSARRAPGPQVRRANSPPGRKPSTRRSKPRGNGRGLPRAQPNTPGGLGWGHASAGHPAVWPALGQVPRAGQDPSAATHHRGGTQGGEAGRVPAELHGPRRPAALTSLTRTTCTAGNTLPNGRHDNRPALGVAIGVGGRFRPVCLASAGPLPVSGHARQGRRIMRRPVRAVRTCRQDPDGPGAAPARAAAERVVCRSVGPVWPWDRDHGLRP
jgi:hypothetical protein